MGARAAGGWGAGHALAAGDGWKDAGWCAPRRCAPVGQPIRLLHAPNPRPPALPARPADMSELNLQRGMAIAWPDGKDKPLHFEIAIAPDEGVYRCENGCWIGGGWNDWVGGGRVWRVCFAPGRPHASSSPSTSAPAAASSRSTSACRPRTHTRRPRSSARPRRGRAGRKMDMWVARMAWMRVAAPACHLCPSPSSVQKQPAC